VECIFKDSKVGFVAYVQVLGCGGYSEVVRGCDVRQDKRRVGDVGMVGDCFVYGLEGTICSPLWSFSAELRPKMTRLPTSKGFYKNLT